MKRILFLSFLFFNINYAYSQSNCDSLLSEPLIHTKLNDQFKWDIVILFSCGIIPEDVEIIDWELMLDYVHRKYENPKYKDLKSSIETFRKKSTYKEAKKKIVCEKIAAIIPKLSYWKTDKIELINCGVSEEELELLKSNLDKINWNTKLCFAELINRKPYFKMPFETTAFKRLVLETSEYPKVENYLNPKEKKILLFFKSDQSVNCHKIEDFILKNAQVAKVINEHFVLYIFSTSDDTLLPESEWIKGKRNKVYKTVGEVNLYYQMTIYESNFQPQFVIINKEKEIKIQTGYIERNDFLNFLKN